VQGERPGRYWDLDEAAWMPTDDDPGWSAPVEDLADDPPAVAATPAPAQPT
jgi:hypothetical protein